MVIGFGILFLWSIISLVLYLTRGETVITNREIYIGGQPILFNLILSLLLTSLFTIIGILLDNQ